MRGQCALRRLVAVTALSQIGASSAMALQRFSAGYLVPETISAAPAAFGDYGGQYLVVDAGPQINGFNDQSLVYRTAATGGPPSVFVAEQPPIDRLLSEYHGGLFLPPDYGPHGGEFVVTVFGGLV